MHEACFGLVFRCICIAAMVLCAPSVNGQPAFETDARLVLVPVTVSDKRGAPIDGLSAQDFVLTDEGVPQAIRLDTSDAVAAPFSVVVAIQSSSVASSALAKINRVGGMIAPLIAGERGATAVIAFDDEIRLIQDFTSDSQHIRAAFQAIHGRSGAGARLLDAVNAAAGMLAARPANRRRIVVLLSEARDRGSKTKLAQAIEHIERSGATVYPLTFSAYLTPWTAKPEDSPPTDGGLLTGLGDLLRHGKEPTAEALARASGGVRFSFNTLRALEQSLTRAGETIHSQYLLSFAPAQSAGNEFHRIDVAVPSRPEALIRARRGYWTNPH